MGKKMQDNLPIIKQANVMIQGRQTISLPAKRVVVFGGKKINPDSENPNEIRVAFSEYAEFIDTRDVNNWKGRKILLDKIFANLNSNPLVVDIKDEDTGKRIYAKHNWVQSLELNEITGELKIVYTDEVRKFFVFLQSQPYTNTLYEIGKYKSIFTVRIKEIIESEKFKKQSYFDVPLEKLKWKLGVENKYERFYDFKRYVLEVAQRELKDNDSPVQFSFETLGRHKQPVKRGVHAIRFYPRFNYKEEEIKAVESKKKKEEKDEPVESITGYKERYPNLFKKLKEWGLSEQLVCDFIQEKGSPSI